VTKRLAEAKQSGEPFTPVTQGNRFAYIAPDRVAFVEEDADS